MFSGIVQGTRKIIAVDENLGIRRLKIDLTGLTENLQNGASVSVNGVCLTVVAIEKEHVRFDVIRETLNRSNLDALKTCLLYTSPSPRDGLLSRMPSSA